MSLERPVVWTAGVDNRGGSYAERCETFHALCCCSLIFFLTHVVSRVAPLTLPCIYKMLHKKKELYSVWWGDIITVLALCVSYGDVLRIDFSCFLLGPSFGAKYPLLLNRCQGSRVNSAVGSLSPAPKSCRFHLCLQGTRVHLC